MSIFIVYIALLFILFILIPLSVGLVLLIIFSRRRKTRATQVSPIADASCECKRPLAQILKDHRLRCGMTQELVAEKMDVSRQAVSKWENGTSEPSTANLIALSQLYGVDPGELLKAVQS